MEEQQSGGKEMSGPEKRDEDCHPTPLPARALPEDVLVQGHAVGQPSGTQRQAGPQRIQHGLPPALQKLQGAWSGVGAGVPGGP